jgi:hypothetical protein
MPDLARYALWCGVAATAEGNRREYAMTTAWLPHLATNTFSLLLPDLLRVAVPPARAAGPPRTAWPLLRETLATVVRDNQRYVLYVAPLAAGYLLSAPWLNIYKGELAELRLAGFGLDALPHAATAFALCALVGDTLRAASALAPPDGAASELLHRLAGRRALTSAAALALATLLWELGEYRIHRYELALRGDSQAINMQWSLPDTLSDCAANAIGWLLAIRRP